jgi:signal transduction histidine kinase
MTLQRKFAVLLGVLVMAVVANVTAALFVLTFLEREVASPWDDLQRIQRGLNDVKRAASAQAHLWAPDFPITEASSPPPAQDPSARPATHELRSRFDAAGADISAAMNRLGEVEMFRLRTGLSTTLNLRSRVAAAQAAGRAWTQAPNDDAATKTASAEYFTLHELIERMESANLAGASFDVNNWRAIRPFLLVVLAASLLDALLAGALGVVLMRRWVVRPVSVLRAATVRLAQGDFAHRVPVTGRDELGLLSAEINHMTGMISAMQDERVDRERLAAVGEMVRRLAHNLRNPLAGIRSLAELARADLPPESATHETQDRIVDTVDRFERWLRDLLTATTPQSVVPQPAPVASWLESSLKPLHPLAQTKAIELITRTADAPAIASFDPRHLEQAVVSVVTNAIQASPRGQPVIVTAKACEDGQSWEVRVEDLGPGVNASLVDKIFRPYFTTKRDGTGIGLAVAKQVVEQHGGRIWVEDRPLRSGNTDDQMIGAAFVMRLPLATDGERSTELARFGQGGADGGHTSDRRRRGESPVLNPADTEARRA